MNKTEIDALTSYITQSLSESVITPETFFKNISKILPADNKLVYKSFLSKVSRLDMDLKLPLIITRGFNHELSTEEQLSSYLPEEKILINKDIFRSCLKDRDLSTLGGADLQRVIDQLNKESIGLTQNDVLLYFNLLKINQLSNARMSGSYDDVNHDYPSELFKLAKKAFNLTAVNIKKVNGARSIEEESILKLLKNSISRNKMNPQVLSICLGYKSTKFIEMFVGFITFFVNQRGDDPQDILSYIALYILFNGANSKDLGSLNLNANVEAFVSDRIGRVKSVYYVAMLFMHTFNVLLTAQIYEISNKYMDSSLDQRLKLEKLYSADNRRTLLVDNALGIATRKISTYKNESLEVLSAYKRYSGNSKDLVTVKDLFNNDWRK